MASLAKVILTQNEALGKLSRNAFGELQKVGFGLTGAIGNGVNKATDNASFPFRTVLYLAKNDPKLKSKLIGAYDSVVNACKKKATKELLESNSESTKIKMGSLLSGLCYLITPTQILGVATANSSIFGSEFNPINIPATLEKDCLWGQLLETKTLDDTYTEYSLHRTVKGVTINNIKADDVFVIPYNELVSVMAIIEGLLKSGKVLRILTEAAGGRHKEAFYTRDPRVLSAFSDDEEYFKNNKVSTLISPFRGFLYEPRIGVSTLKSIVGRIDIDKVSKIEVVTAQEQITVNKASKTEAIEREKLQTCISNALAQKRIEDPAAQEQLINSIPGAKELFGSDIKLVYERTYMLNDLFEDYDIASLRKVVTALGAAEEYMQMSSIISENYKDIPVAGMSKGAFDSLLRLGVYRVTYRYSSSGKLSIRYVTKNKDYLKLCYGNDYERYGSDFDLGVRASKEPNLKSIDPIELCKKYYQAPEAAINIKQYFIDGTIQRGAGKSFLDGIDFCLNPQKEVDETNNVRAYRMFSPKTREKDGRIKIESFTEFIDYTRVVKIIKLK